MLEAQIAMLTAAVEKNTSVLLRLLEAMSAEPVALDEASATALDAGQADAAVHVPREGEPKAAKGKKPKPEAPPAAAPEAQDPVLESPVDAGAPAPTVDDCRKALGRLSARYDDVNERRVAAIAILSRFGAQKIPDLLEEHYADFIELCEHVADGGEP